MTERNMRYNRNERRHTERARAVTKAKARKQTIIFSVIAAVLVLSIAASFMIFAAANAKPQTAAALPTTATKTITTDSAAAKAPAAQPSQNTTAQAAPAQSTQNDTQQYAQQNTQQNTQQNAQQNAQQPEKKSEDRIDNVNGERVYIDTKRTAPEVTGTPAHYYANGKTSYGFDWTYDADNGNFVLRCDYNFNQQQYDFQFYGTAPGTAHVTVYYFTNDNTKVPVNLTLTVDENLNASIG